MALRGYPGIHAGMPTPQCLRSAIVVNGASRSRSKSKSKSKSKAEQERGAFATLYGAAAPLLSRASSLPHFGLRQPQPLRIPPSPCGSEPAREEASTSNISLAVTSPSRAGSLPQGNQVGHHQRSSAHRRQSPLHRGLLDDRRIGLRKHIQFVQQHIQLLH